MLINVLFFLFSIIAISIIYIVLRKRIDKLTNTDKLVSEITNNLDIILSEINQATERNIIVIEDKISELKKIIEIADKRISLLKDEKIKLSTPKENTIENLGNEENQHYKEKALNVEIPKKSKEIENELTYSHLNRMSAMSGMIAPSITTKEKKVVDKKTQKEQIIALYKSGIDATLIAKNIGVSLGEVQLVISLHTGT